MARKRLRTLVVDDEPVARSVLTEELAEIDHVQVVGEAENGEAALRQIERLEPDLVLLDIQMPVMDGFEVVRRVAGPLPAVVFVTAYSEHALRAFEVGAVDYLLKPIAAERLRQALQRARDSLRRPADSAERLVRSVNAASAPRKRSPKIVARKGREFHLLDLDEIYAFQADGEVVWILTADRKYAATRTLQAIEDELAGQRFQRVRRGVLVNTEKVRKLSALGGRRWLLTLANGLEFAVSKRQAPAVRSLFS